MTDEQRNSLRSRGADIDDAMYRFCGNEKVYTSCLSAFLEDSSMQTFREAMKLHAWDDARAAIHTLKGIAGNMGFVPLMKISQQLVDLLRADRYREAEDAAAQLERHYGDISEGIKIFLADAGDNL